jgi:hypothetical protein
MADDDDCSSVDRLLATAGGSSASSLSLDDLVTASRAGRLIPSSVRVTKPPPTAAQAAKIQAAAAETLAVIKALTTANVLCSGDVATWGKCDVFKFQRPARSGDAVPFVQVDKTGKYSIKLHQPHSHDDPLPDPVHILSIYFVGEVSDNQYFEWDVRLATELPPGVRNTWWLEYVAMLMGPRPAPAPPPAPPSRPPAPPPRAVRVRRPLAAARRAANRRNVSTSGIIVGCKRVGRATR